MNDKYIVVFNTNVEQFESDVAVRLSQGYRLVGGISIASVYAGADVVSGVFAYSQALVKDSDERLPLTNQEGAEGQS